MRSLVPVFAFLLLSVVSASAFAETSPSFTDFSRNFACATSPANSVRDLACRHAKTLWCPGADRASDCITSKPASPGTAAVDLSTFNGLVETAIATCMKKSNPAHGCCSSFKGCGVKAGTIDISETEGMEETCKRLKNETGFGKTFNSQVSGTCLARKEICAYNCEDLVKQLTTVHAAAAATIGPIESTKLKDLVDLGAKCKALNSNTVEAQAEEMSSAAGYGKLCGSLVKDDPNIPGPNDPANPNDPSNPSDPSGPGDTAPGGQPPANAGGGLGESLGPMLQAAMPMLMQSLMGQQETPIDPQTQQPYTCETLPSMPGCPGAATTEKSWNEASGTADANSEPEGTGEFNLQNTGDIPMPQSLGADTSLAKGSPPTVNSIPNGGGGIPGGGGGGPASLGGGGGGGGAQLGSKADILHGTSSPSGSFSQQNAAMNLKSGDSGGYTYGGGGLHDETMNLADFLPGGKNDPTKRNVAGIGAGTAGTNNFQIQSKDVNIWNRISDRIKSRCSQGLLRDCIP